MISANGERQKVQFVRNTNHLQIEHYTHAEGHKRCYSSGELGGNRTPSLWFTIQQAEVKSVSWNKNETLCK